MKGSDGWLLHALNSRPPFCVQVVGIMPNDESPSAWSSSPPPYHGVGFDPSSQEEVLGKISKLRGTYMQIFGFFGYLCGLKWVKIICQIDTKTIYSRIQIEFKYLKLCLVDYPHPPSRNKFFLYKFASNISNYI